MTNTYDVITVGSSTVDIFADTTRDELIEITRNDSTDTLIAYPLGSKIPVDHIRQDVGGTGVNVAVGLSRLNQDTAYAGKVGTDTHGEFIMQRLDDEHVDFIGGRGEKSGMGIILDTHLGEDRTILSYKGCNNSLTPKDVTDATADLWYFSSMLNESWQTMTNLAEKAHQRGETVAFNPSSTIAVKGREHIKPVLQNTDILLVNDEEAELIAEQGSLKENMDELAKTIPTVVITRGSDGVIAHSANHTYRARPKTCDVVETTGAGDAFSSGFLAGHLNGLDVQDQIRAGMLNAESVLCQYGAHNELLTWEQLQERLEGDDRTVESTRHKL